ncbi:MAG: RNA polymerase sigma factor [Roseiflexaceae bacterium]
MNDRLPIETTFDIEALLSAERQRLVRLCAHFSGDRDAAEDLVQETLIEAWRHRDRLVDPQGCDRWLTAIARNVSLRWARRQGRDRARRAFFDAETPGAGGCLDDLPAEQDDLAVDLERDELAHLLDRALALLPAETRQVLVEKYVAESPLAVIAANLGLSEGAVAVRLHRGRLALRRVLTTELSGEAAAYGLSIPTNDGWQETRIWCPLCGQRRLTSHMDASIGEFALRCSSCTAKPDLYLTYAQFPGLLDGIKGYKPALSRVMTWSDEHYRRRLNHRMVVCLICGHPTALRDGWPDDAPVWPWALHTAPLHTRCNVCSVIMTTSHTAMALCLPEGRQFWQEHPKIRFRSVARIEAEGCAALVSSFESLSDSARFEVVSNLDTCAVIRVHTYP